MKADQDTIPLYGIIGSYNEDDIIYATVKNLLAQGCSRVFLVDNCSTDDTVVRALEAGAEIAMSFVTDSYNEMQRIIHINDQIERISRESSHDQIWWIAVDCDEFPSMPGRLAIVDFLATLPEDVTTVGSSQINHFPAERDYPRFTQHPWVLMPLAEEYDTKKFPVSHCDSGHWKHPIIRFRRDGPRIRYMTGFHKYLSAGIEIREAQSQIETHHFPFRDLESTKSRLGFTRSYKEIGRNKLNEAWSPGGISGHTRRLRSLEAVYDQRWTEVDIDPAPDLPGRVPGVYPRRLAFDALNWQEPEDSERKISKLRAQVWFANSETISISGGRIHAALIAKTLAELDISVELVTNFLPDVLRDKCAHANLRVVEIGNQEPSHCDLVFFAPSFERFPGKVTSELTRYLRKNTSAELIYINFETPNWVNSMTDNPKSGLMWTAGLEMVDEFGAYVQSTNEISRKFAEPFFQDMGFSKKVEHIVWSPPLFNRDDETAPNENLRSGVLFFYREQNGENKGSELLLRALKESWARDHKWTIIIGTLPDTNSFELDVKEIAKTRGLEVSFRFQVEESELHHLYRTSKVLFYPSNFEGWGMPPIEAAARGCYPICRNLEVIENSLSGTKIRFAENDDELLSSLKENLEKSGRLMITEDQAKLRERFSSERAEMKMSFLVEEVVTMRTLRQEQKRLHGHQKNPTKSRVQSMIDKLYSYRLVQRLYAGSPAGIRKMAQRIVSAAK